MSQKKNNPGKKDDDDDDANEKKKKWGSAIEYKRNFQNNTSNGYKDELNTLDLKLLDF